MLSDDYRRHLSTQRSIGGALALAGAGLGVAGATLSSTSWFGGVALFATGAVVVWLGAARLLSRPASLNLLSDRPIRVAGQDSGSHPRSRLSLTAAGSELDAVASQLELRTLSSFSVFSLRPGAACHSAAALARTLDGLISALPDQPELPDAHACLDALAALRQQCAAAERSGAQVCLHPTNAWSGAMETNLRLFLAN